MIMDTPKVRHILSLSGGKDSTALAVYMKDKIPNVEYVFCDTGEELKEIYAYLDKLEAYLEQPIIRLNPDRPFSHYLQIFNGVLPDVRTRWCTRVLKIKPFEDYVGNDQVYSYIAIRADELQRKGYISTKPNITPIYPFIDDFKYKEDIFKILEESGIGVPEYYKWRSRSGCYFCFFQQKKEWVGLREHHPELYEKAKQFEKFDPKTGKRFSWNQNESLTELEQPERLAQITSEIQLKQKQTQSQSPFLLNVFDSEEDEANDGCLVCHL
jgi:3'-phosphoadenosine 5'-phosphosulfate sulfotransferase (PAPS reductase)/FAD synthetase